MFAFCFDHYFVMIVVWVVVCLFAFYGVLDLVDWFGAFSWLCYFNAFSGVWLLRFDCLDACCFVGFVLL